MSSRKTARRTWGVPLEAWLVVWLAASGVAHIGAAVQTHDGSLTAAHLLIDAILGGFLTGFIWLIWFVVIAVLDDKAIALACARCGTAPQSGVARFCGECGAPLPTEHRVYEQVSGWKSIPGPIRFAIWVLAVLVLIGFAVWAMMILFVLWARSL